MSSRHTRRVRPHARASVKRLGGVEDKHWRRVGAKRRRRTKRGHETFEVEAVAQSPQPAETTESETATPTTPAEFAEFAQKHALEALRVLAESMSTAGSETVRVSAANSVLDRAYGKPLPGKAADEGPRGPIEVRWVDPNFP